MYAEKLSLRIRGQKLKTRVHETITEVLIIKLQLTLVAPCRVSMPPVEAGDLVLAYLVLRTS